MLKNMSKKAKIALAIFAFLLNLKLYSQINNSNNLDLICYLSIQDCSTCNSVLSNLSKNIRQKIIICPSPYNEDVSNLLKSNLELEKSNFSIADPSIYFNELPKRSGVYLKSGGELHYISDIQSANIYEELLNSFINSQNISFSDIAYRNSFMQYLSGIKLFNNNYLTYWNSFTNKVFIYDIESDNKMHIDLINYDYQRLLSTRNDSINDESYMKAFDIIKSMKKDKAELLQVLASDINETTLLLRIYLPILNEFKSLEISPITFISIITNNLALKSTTVIDETKLPLCNSIDGYSSIKYLNNEIEVFLDFDLESGKCKKKQWKGVFKYDSLADRYLFLRYLSIKRPEILTDKSVERDYIILQNEEYISFNQLNEFYNTSGIIKDFKISEDIFNPSTGDNLIDFRITNGFKYFIIEKQKSFYFYVFDESNHWFIVNLNKIYDCEFISSEFSKEYLSLLNSNGNVILLKLN